MRADTARHALSARETVFCAMTLGRGMEAAGDIGAIRLLHDLIIRPHASAKAFPPMFAN